MNFLKRWVESSKNQEKFWREFHQRRREKRMEYWDRQRQKHLRRAFVAGRMAQYYMDRLIDGDTQSR